MKKKQMAKKAATQMGNICKTQCLNQKVNHKQLGFLTGHL
jgi:hypothetical protein